MFPVDTVPILLIPRAAAFCTTTAVPRSLKLWVGFMVSFFANTAGRPYFFLSLSSGTSGVFPSPRLSAAVDPAERQEIAIDFEREPGRGARSYSPRSGWRDEHRLMTNRTEGKKTSSG